MPHLSLILASLLSLTATPRPDGEGSNAPAGEVTLGPGRVARYAYHFDRNALRDSLRVGDALVALTRSGNLLRFDLATLRPTREWSGPVPASCLGRGEGGVPLVGFEDGRIARVDPVTLGLAEVARVPGKVQWVGFATAAGGRPGGVVAVAELSRPFDASGRTYRAPSSTVHDLATGKAYRVAEKVEGKPGEGGTFDLHATAFLLDAHRRLWLGGDRGEWGGWCARIDLPSGRVDAIPGTRREPPLPAHLWEGVYGFAELRDGRVWALGGTMHMGFTDGFVCRVDGGTAEEVVRVDNEAALKAIQEEKEPPEPGRPTLPITHLIEEPDGNLLVFSYSHLYRADRGLKAWTKLHTFQIRYRSGRPDAVGSYPSMVAVHRLDGPGLRLVASTSIDGLVRLDGDAGSYHAIPGQLGGDVDRIMNTAEGMLFLDQSLGDLPWRLRDGAWSVAPLEPPFEPLPGEPQVEDERDRSWSETRLMAGPGGMVTTVSASLWSPGTRTTARWRGGKAEVLGRETSSLNVSACFATPDGSLWNAWYGELRRIESGRWSFAAALPGEDKLAIGWGLRAVVEAGPPWVLLDPDKRKLLRLDPGGGGRTPTLSKVDLAENGKPLEVRDAIGWSPGVLLLATGGGPRRLDLSGGKVGPSPLPDPGRPVSVLARDGLGRVWLGGEGLWLVDGAGTLVDCAAVPMLGRSPVSALAADPDQKDGVVASIEDRGVVFVRVAPGP